MPRLQIEIHWYTQCITVRRTEIIQSTGHRSLSTSPRKPENLEPAYWSFSLQIRWCVI